MNQITVQTIINAPIERVRGYCDMPGHITGWAFGSDNWEAPTAENDLCVDGKLKIVMAAKDRNVNWLCPLAFGFHDFFAKGLLLTLIAAFPRVANVQTTKRKFL